MDVKEAIQKTKTYIGDLFADEHISNLGLEEVDYDKKRDAWAITLAFSRPWNTPRTKAQEVLEQLGSASSLKRSYKVVTISKDGDIVSMKDRIRGD